MKHNIKRQAKSQPINKIRYLMYKLIQSIRLIVTLDKNNNNIPNMLSTGVTGKGQFSFQSLITPIPKNAQTTAQLNSSHTLVK